MAARDDSPYSFILMTFLVALLLSIVVLPEWARALRPEFMTMMLIYWCLSAPGRVGIGVAWMLGLVMDTAYGALLGQHALMFTVVSWGTLKLHQRIRLFPIWQQALSVFLLILLAQMLSMWIRGMAGQPPQTWMYWLPSITSLLLWPVFYSFMHGMRRYLRV